VNHVGFIVDNVQQRVAQWKAAGVTVLPGGMLPDGKTRRLDQAYVETPDGVRMEILEDKAQTVPIRNEHIHLALPAAEIPKAQAWYAKTFGGQAATRNNAPVVNLPGVQIGSTRPTRSRRRREVMCRPLPGTNDHPAFVKRLGQASNSTSRLARAPLATRSPITDPWGRARDRPAPAARAAGQQTN
jgi:catechol 2,3-dioxygenase-like lactoylglutathione lyase family enzyme